MQYSIATTFLAACIALSGCEAGRRERVDTTRAGTAVDTMTPARSADSAIAALKDASGKELGNLTLRESAGKIVVNGQLTGLPRGEHAIHLHTVGKCERPKFESAGDHWNPTGREHGTRNPEGPHLGDLPNFTVRQDGSGQIEVTSPGGTLRAANPLLDSDGAAVVAHAKPDDYRSQPSGDSGDRIACGVVSSQSRAAR
jgi:superoxide dismutase, Cu-Zn family